MPYEPKIIAYLCTWCSYTGADTAGIARLKSPANLRAIRVPCSGRVSPEIIMRTFDQGADGVLVLGCHIGECHYETGNHRTAKRLPIIQAMMTFAGLEPERLRLDWVSASEGERFSRIANEFVQSIRALGPAHWRTPPETLPANLQSSFDEILPPLLNPEPSSILDPSNLALLNQQYTHSIQSTSQELLENQRVNCVIGYEIGPRGRTRPAFIHHPDEVSRLVWNQDCTHNLTTYLTQMTRTPNAPDRSRVGIVVKPCDSRAVNVLLSENRIRRDQVYLIGVECPGIRQGAGANRFSGYDTFTLQERCQSCDERIPKTYDTLISSQDHAAIVQKPANSLPGIDHYLNKLDALSPEQRMEFWLSQFDRCIRCYACRQACPMCECPTCLYERDDSLWVGMGIRLNEKRTFHLGRAYHLAGRCVDCNECERVCPMNIPLSLINRKLAQEIEQLFGYRAGESLQPSPVVTALSGEERLP